MRRRIAQPATMALVLLALAAGALAVLASVPAPANLSQALAAQRQLLDQRPSDAAAWNDLGNLLVLAGETEAAEEAYGHAVELGPDHSTYHYNLALLLQQRGELRQARSAYRQVVELDPNNAWAHFQLGALAEARGQDRRAVEHFTAALRLDPDLAFPDVNPAVIDSHLLTESMLRAYRDGATGSAAPRIYEQPGRISALLLPPSDTAPAPEQAARHVETGGGKTTGATTAGGSSGGPRRILTEGDLGSGPVNQAAPAAGAGRAGYRPPGGARRSPPRPEVRTWVQPGGTTDDQGRDAGPTPRQRTIVPGGIELTPTLPSTGRLEMRFDEGSPTAT